MFDTAQNLRIVQGSIESITEGGLFTFRGKDGSTYREITMTSLAMNAQPRLGTPCVILTDGARHFYMGEELVLKVNSEGLRTILPENLPFEPDTMTKALVSSDEVGATACVMVSAGDGVLVDSGGVALMHVGSGDGKLTESWERHEVISPIFTQQHDHDGRDATHSLVLRTAVDEASVARQAELEEDAERELAHTVHVESKRGAPLTIELRQQGQVRATVSFDSDGKVFVDSEDDILLRAAGEVLMGGLVGHNGVAWAQNVLVELQKIALALNTHQHLYIIPAIPAGTAPTVPLLPTPLYTPPNLASEIGSTKVKAT
jgi:hypothetical protein